jgi:hypothetical protein
MRTTYGPEAATLANACLHYVFDLWAGNGEGGRLTVT